MRKFLKSQGVVFNPDTIDILSQALDEAWESVTLSGAPLVRDGNRSGVREMLARRIVDMAQAGERDPAKLRNDALLHLAVIARRAAAAVASDLEP